MPQANDLELQRESRAKQGGHKSEQRTNNGLHGSEFPSAAPTTGDSTLTSLVKKVQKFNRYDLSGGTTEFGSQYIGIREAADKIWLVSFMDYDLGFFHKEDNRVEPVGHNPFAPKVLPMSSE